MLLRGTRTISNGRMPLYYLFSISIFFIDKLIINTLFNDPKYDYDDVSIVEII